MATRKPRVRLVTGSISAGKELRKDKDRVNRAGERLHAKRRRRAVKNHVGSNSHIAVEARRLSDLALNVNQSQPYAVVREFVADLVALHAAGVLDPGRRATSLQALPKEDRDFAKAALGRLDAFGLGISQKRLIDEAEWSVFIGGEGLRAREVVEILAGRARPVLGLVSGWIFTRPRG